MYKIRQGTETEVPLLHGYMCLILQRMYARIVRSCGYILQSVAEEIEKSTTNHLHTKKL